MRILYGVAGEGMGHAVRSKAVIEELSKKHDVLVVAGDKAYKFLKNHFPTHYIRAFKIIHKNNIVSNIPTFFYNLFTFPGMLIYNSKLFRIYSRGTWSLQNP